MGVNLSQNARYGVLKKVDKDSQVVHQDEYSLSKFGIKTSCAEMERRARSDTTLSLELARDLQSKPNNIFY